MVVDISAIPVFKCRNCGRCCRDFDTDDESNRKAGFFVGPVFRLNPINLPFFDWEVPFIEEELKKISSERKIVPSQLVFDIIHGETIVVDYSLDDGVCPFLVGGKCGIYEKRPIVCRQYPLIHDLPEPGEPYTLYVNRECAGDNNDNFKHIIEEVSKGPVRVGEINEMLSHRYGDAYLYALVAREYRKMVIASIVSLERKGVIKTAKQGYTLQYLVKRINQSKHVPMSVVVEQETGMNPKDLFDVERIRDVLD